MSIDVKTVLRQGDTRVLTVTVTNLNSSVSDLVLRVNASFGAFASLSSSLCRTVVYTKVPAFGTADFVECALSAGMSGGASMSFNFVLMAALNVTTTASFVNITAAVSPQSTEWTWATPVSLPLPDFSRVWSLTSANPPLNLISFGSVITLTGINLQSMPSRLFLGPYVVAIVIVDDHTAIVTVPNSTATSHATP